MDSAIIALLAEKQMEVMQLRQTVEKYKIECAKLQEQVESFKNKTDDVKKEEE